MSALNEVRAASARFYAALNRMAAGDATSMQDVWIHSADVSAQHPIGGRDEGYDTVIASFTKVAGIAGGGKLELLNQRIDAGSDLAVETGVETGALVIAGHKASVNHRVTNVYRKTEAGWKLAHHHTDLSGEMLDILKRLNEAA